MSRVENQYRLFLELIEELRPWWRRDPGLPRRLQAWLRRHRAGSRDRRLYRELAYTAWRILPWIEDSAPEVLVARVANHAHRTAATESFLQTFANPAVTDPVSVPLWPDWVAAEFPSRFDSSQSQSWRSPAPLWIRSQSGDDTVWREELQSLGLQPEPSAPVPGAWKLPAQTRLQDTHAYRQGLIEIQDAGSQALLLTLPQPLSGEWLDACAGAGGKTLQLACLLAPAAGRVTAHDIRDGALRELAARRSRAQLKNVTISRSPTGRFDGVLVDAPCTGSGTWRRAPHLKWTTTPKTIRRAARQQSGLLARFADLVKPGGWLIYTTCSLCRSENDEVVADFLSQHRHYGAVDLPHPVAGTGDTRPGLHLLPADLDANGYFVTALRNQAG